MQVWKIVPIFSKTFDIQKLCKNKTYEDLLELISSDSSDKVLSELLLDVSSLSSISQLDIMDLFITKLLVCSDLFWWWPFKGANFTELFELFDWGRFCDKDVKSNIDSRGSEINEIKNKHFQIM